MVFDITMNDLEVGEIFKISDDTISIVMFFGSTCGPCKATMPNYEKVSEFFANRTDKIITYRLNAWEPPEQKEYCETKWGIKGVPTFKVFLKDVEIHTRVGGGDEPALKEMFVQMIDKVFKEHGIII